MDNKDALPEIYAYGLRNPWRYAFDPANGNPIWHTQIGQVTNAPETFMVGGRQHILVAAGDSLYAFALYE